MTEILKFYSVVDCMYDGERKRFQSNEVEVEVVAPYVITQKSNPIVCPPPKACERRTPSLLLLLLLCLK